MSHIVTLSKYGHECLNIRRAYATDILRYTSFRVSWEKMANFSAFIQIEKLGKLSNDFLGLDTIEFLKRDVEVLKGSFH